MHTHRATKTVGIVYFSQETTDHDKGSDLIQYLLLGICTNQTRVHKQHPPKLQLILLAVEFDVLPQTKFTNFI